MKNPNGYGSVYKLTDKRRRKPWVVRVTDSWNIVDGKLKRKYKYIGYYETRKEAMQALSEYNVNPAAVTKDILFADLYKMWSEEKYQSFWLNHRIRLILYQNWKYSQPTDDLGSNGKTIPK